MKRIILRLLLLSSLVGYPFVLCQCDDNTLAPFEPEIVSVPDNFELQATGVRNRTTTLIYDWENTGTRATVNHSTTTSSGSARLIIKDAVGDTVYDKLLVPSLNDSTTLGTTGAWEIHLVLDHYYGTLNFRVQKL
jgi:hypothetical protein